MSDYTIDIPRQVLGAAWSVQKARMDAGIYVSLFLVQIQGNRKRVLYLSADLQEVNMFVERKPLSITARRAGWQGFHYSFSESQKSRFVLLYDSEEHV
jgi:hypothetical protein